MGSCTCSDTIITNLRNAPRWKQKNAAWRARLRCRGLMTDNLPPPSREHPQPEYSRITESKFWGSFHYAFSGIMYATRTQPNMRIHLLIAAAVLIAAMLLHLERIYV